MRSFFHFIVLVRYGVGLQTAVYVCLTSCRLGCKTAEDEDEAQKLQHGAVELSSLYPAVGCSSSGLPPSVLLFQA